MCVVQALTKYSMLIQKKTYEPEAEPAKGMSLSKAELAKFLRHVPVHCAAMCVVKARMQLHYICRCNESYAGNLGEAMGGT